MHAQNKSLRCSSTARALVCAVSALCLPSVCLWGSPAVWAPQILEVVSPELRKVRARHCHSSRDLLHTVGSACSGVPSWTMPLLVPLHQQRTNWTCTHTHFWAGASCDVCRPRQNLRATATHPTWLGCGLWHRQRGWKVICSFVDHRLSKAQQVGVQGAVHPTHLVWRHAAGALEPAADVCWHMCS